MKATNTITKESICTLMHKAYTWQRANQTRWVIRSTGKHRYLKATDWERGVFWSGVATAWHATGNEAYLDGLADYTLNTGFRAGPLINFADDQVCIQAYLDIYKTLKCPDAIQYSEKALESMLQANIVGHELWWWADALFMAAPTMSAFAAQSQQSIYWECMDKYWWDAVEYLYDKESGLYYRDKRYMPAPLGDNIRELNGEKVFWARGIGWILAAIPRLLKYLPIEHPSRKKYLEMFCSLAEKIIEYQFDDGLWRTSLLDPVQFPEPESSATSLFCYAFSWGINENVLNERFKMSALAAWQGLCNCVNEEGRLGFVQLPAYNPRKVQEQHNIDYGTGVLLLAGSEMLHMI